MVPMKRSPAEWFLLAVAIPPAVWVVFCVVWLASAAVGFPRGFDGRTMTLSEATAIPPTRMPRGCFAAEPIQRASAPSRRHYSKPREHDDAARSGDGRDSNRSGPDAGRTWCGDRARLFCAVVRSGGAAEQRHAAVPGIAAAQPVDDRLHRRSSAVVEADAVIEWN